MAKRRNYSTKEIIEISPADFTQVMREDEAGSDIPIDGGSNTDEIGVPKNFRIVEEEVVDYYGEYRINITIEFEAVSGATNYQSENIQSTPSVPVYVEVPE